MAFIIDNYQFKRVFSFKGTMDEAIANIKTRLNPALMEGEPIICSYLDNGVMNYFLAIGMDEGTLKVFPSFDSMDDFVSFIRKYSGSDLIDLISEDSDFTVELDSNHRYILKIKKDLLSNFNWVEL